ncbi:MAG TPA: hypothetical protein VJ124_00625, partial [Pyrinomonadaceae bacterium]|nr:hypothetical protein [Pyrinomonadaceae bacterium]
AGISCGALGANCRWVIVGRVTSAWQTSGRRRTLNSDCGPLSSFKNQLDLAFILDLFEWKVLGQAVKDARVERVSEVWVLKKLDYLLIPRLARTRGNKTDQKRREEKHQRFAASH